jgi:hypothetical protein
MTDEKTAEVIYIPAVEKAKREAEIHQCKMPDVWRSDGRNAGAIAYCDECGTYWHYSFSFFSAGEYDQHKWRRVRWYNFKTRGRINGRE